MRLRVDINFGQKVEISEMSTNAQENNVANAPTHETGGYRGFQLSEKVNEPVTPLNGAYQFFAKAGYAGWMSQQLSDSDGNFSSPIRWEIIFSAKVSSLNVTFDTTLNEYASELELYVGDAEEAISIQNNHPTLILTFPATTKVSLEIKKWNKAHKTAKITKFSGSGVLSFMGSAVESVECSEQAWNSSFQVSAGVMQQYADITFRDHAGVLASLSDAGQLTSFMPLDVYVEHKKEWKFLGTYISDIWSVDRVEDRVSVSCNDYTRNIPNYTVDVIGANMSVKQFLDLLGTQMPEIEIVAKPNTEIKNVMTGETISLETYLENCICGDVYFQGEDADVVLEDLCDRWLLRAYWQADLKKYVVMEAW